MSPANFSQKLISPALIFEKLISTANFYQKLISPALIFEKLISTLRGGVINYNPTVEFGELLLDTNAFGELRTNLFLIC